MSQNKQRNQIIMKSTTINGYLYHVYHKDDLDQEKILYTGEISEDPKHCYCECTGFSLLRKCYHQTKAKETMEVKIV